MTRRRLAENGDDVDVERFLSIDPGIDVDVDTNVTDRLLEAGGGGER